jgi:putative transposase
MVRKILTDIMWDKIKNLLPQENGYWGRPSRPHREIIEGILWIFRTGAPWRDLPVEYGPWSSTYNRFNRWTAAGIWTKIWDALKEDIDDENHILDSSFIKAHQDACRVKKKMKRL